MFDISGITRAATVDAALRALSADPEAVVIAGGTDVLIKIREGRLAGKRLVSIHDIPELKGIGENAAGDLLIRPLSTFHDLSVDPLIRRHIPILAAAADSVGGPQIRAMGTVGGNISNGVTSADTASTLFVLDAVLTLCGLDGERMIPIADYYLGPGKVSLKPGELLTLITVRRESYAGFGGCYLKYAMRNAMDIATLGTAAMVKASGDRRHIETLKLAFGVAAPIPMRALATETAISGLTLKQAEAEIAALVRAEINPRSSWRASREFRLQIAGENAKRALRAAFAAAGGEA